MGEVYRARDARLERDVAIKVLPELLASDEERVARFEREAKTLAALNHPNIAHIYQIEHAGTSLALVMELVEGEDLSQRISRGPVPVDETLAIARQTADALEAAHEQGIIHRDLKPANIKVRRDGTVKVLDFGLAKAMDPIEAGRPDQSPTLTARATQMGTILGTAAYMAPEQARGKPVDKRADIWAFGVVLYEMLTGTRAFGGDDMSDVLAAVLRQEIDWKSIPPDTPPRLRRLLERCLERDARTRLRDIGEARVEIAKIESGDTGGFAGDAPSAAIPGDAWRNRLGWITSAVLAIALAAAGWMLWTDRNRHSSSPARPVRLVFDPPSNLSYDGGSADSVAVSPDGRLLVFTGRSPDGQRQLWMQALDSGEAKGVAGNRRSSHAVLVARQPIDRVRIEGETQARGPCRRTPTGDRQRAASHRRRVEPRRHDRLRSGLQRRSDAGFRERWRCQDRHDARRQTRRSESSCAGLPPRRPALPLQRRENRRTGDLVGIARLGRDAPRDERRRPALCAGLAAVHT